MNFDFSDDQKLFGDTLRRALQRTCPLTEVRRVLESDSEAYSEPAWDSLRSLGVTAAAIPTEYGGLGSTYYELCLAAEEAGRALAPTPLSTSIFLAAELLKLAGSHEQKEEWLPELASGRAIATFAETSVEATVVNGQRISGTYLSVPDARVAQAAIVLADEGEAPDAPRSLFLVRLPGEHVTVRSSKSVDPSRDVCELSLRNASAQPLGPAGEGDRLTLLAKERAAVLVAFEQLGGADRALEMAKDYAMQRTAFGRPVGSYQAIKHKLAEMYVRNELARAHAYFGAWALSTQASELTVAAAAARVSATEAFSFAAQENIQVHGGMGFTWESDCHLFYRRARLLALQLGGVLFWKERLVQALESAGQGVGE